jgi:hypothetical protein
MVTRFVRHLSVGASFLRPVSSQLEALSHPLGGAVESAGQAAALLTHVDALRGAVRLAVSTTRRMKHRQRVAAALLLDQQRIWLPFAMCRLTSVLQP